MIFGMQLYVSRNFSSQTGVLADCFLQSQAQKYKENTIGHRVFKPKILSVAKNRFDHLITGELK